METITLKVSDGTEITGYVARPTEAPKKGIIVIQEAFGVTEHIKHVAERFAPQGFLAIAPEIFHRTAEAGAIFDPADYASGKLAPHFGAVTPEGMIADIQACFDWLVAQGVPKEKIAIIGFCLGGRASFLTNALIPVAAAVSFYGGGIAQNLLDKAKDLHAPQLLIWGGKDAHILPEHRHAIADALTAAGKSYVDITFGDADHAFARDIDPTHYHEASAKEAWALVDAFLANHLV